MKLKKLFTVSIIMLLVLSLVAGCGGSKSSEGQQEPAKEQDKVYVMKIAHGNPPSEDDPYQALALKFKEALESKTDKITVEIYPGGQLGGEQRAFQDMQNNIVQGVVLASNNASVFAPSLSVLDLPFLFKDNDEFKKVVTELNDEFTQIMIDESKTRPIAWGTQGFRVLANSKRPINTMEDLKGVKIRVPSNPIQIAAFKSWDSEPIGMAFDELFGALQQKVVDGLEMTYISLATQKMSEVINYVTDLRYKMAINPLVISEDWFQTLPADLQTAVLEAGSETTDYAIELAESMDKKGMEMLEEQGVELAGRPSDEDLWVEKSMATWPQFYDLIKDPTIVDKCLEILGREKPQA